MLAGRLGSVATWILTSLARPGHSWPGCLALILDFVVSSVEPLPILD
jgi:hypothetical protein